MTTTQSISLIGMPGVGKSSVGILLAKLCGLRFLDTDIDVQVHQGATLEEILQNRGFHYLRRIEEQVLLDIDLARAVIATGGSVVYSAQVMARLHRLGPVIYLQADCALLQQRVAAAPPRGIASDRAQSFADIFAERTPLYEKHADIIVDTGQLNPEQVAADILDRLADTPRTRPPGQ